MPVSKVGFLEGTGLILRLSRFMAHERKSYLTGKLLAALEMVNTLIFPYIFQKMVKIVADPGLNLQRELAVMLGLLLIVILLTPLICFGTLLAEKSVIHGDARLQKAVFAHIQRLSAETRRQNRAGDYLTVLGSDASNSFGIFSSWGIQLVSQFAIVFPVSSVILFYYSWPVAVIAIVFSISCIAVSAIFNPRVSALSQEARREMGTTANHLMELLAGFATARIFAAYGRLLERFTETCKTIFRKRVHYRTLNGIVDAFLNFFQAAAQPFTLIVGMLLIALSKSDTATVVLVSSIAGVMADSARGVGTFVANIQPTLVSARRLFALLDTEPEPERPSRASVTPTGETALSVENLSFSYNGQDPVLDRFSCTVKTGETVALTGPSGCGKSTLFKLIQGFYDPAGGHIAYFGVDGRELSRKDIRKLLAYVPQECTLFEGSIGYNISLGRPGASPQQIRQAAHAAYLDGLIDRLPQGLETPVGEKGALLSGGERQRIAIARAFLKDAPILLLDEATSALDSESEKEVLQALDALMQGRTVLLISHQQSAVAKADRAIAMSPAARRAE